MTADAEIAAPLPGAAPDPAGAGAMADVALRRPVSWPEWWGAATVVGLPVVAGWDRLASLVGRSPACLVRTTFGVPCPLCGGITAGQALLDLDLAGALASSPLAVALVVGGVTMAVVWALRMTGLVAPPRSWTTETSRRAGLHLLVVLIASWAYQLARAG